MSIDDRTLAARTEAVEAVAGRAPDPLREQVRVAMAWNGGVSLAVWMGGVAVEIDAARRAHPDVEPSSDDEPTRTVYAAISHALERELVVDILCGASAGGLNGGLLAAAMRHARRLPVGVMRKTWIDVGDFSTLLQPIGNDSPRSLMRGGSSPTDPGKFYAAVRKVFAAVLDDPAGKPDDADRDECKPKHPIAKVDVMLDVMMTDVEGAPRKFRDAWGFDLAAREYRAPFRFRHDGDFTLDALATAARSSASFPIAFEPFRVYGDGADRAGFRGARYALDGGLLENAPIRSAIDLIPKQPAHMQVKRYLCYVNAAPPKADPAVEDPTAPPLAKVVGYVVNVPRDGRFVDQLYAIEAATRQSDAAATSQPDLLRTDLASLTATATALLRTYRRQRLLRMLDETLDDPAAARAAFDAAPDDADVPWLPVTLAPPGDAANWRWGIHTAQRILHLELDVLRSPLERTRSVAARRALLEARIAIEAQLAGLERLRDGFLAAARTRSRDTPEEILDQLPGIDYGYRQPVVAALEDAWDAFAPALALPIPDVGDWHAFTEALVAGDETRDPRERFLQRALAVEVIRRAFGADDPIGTAQTLLFAQLTPLAPTEIFTYGPRRERPDSPEDKLTGIRLGHFAGFYRRSWRANDFMWGRLDGATRIVDMLVDADRARLVAHLTRRKPWEELADALLTDERAWAIREALEERSGGPVEGDLHPALVSALEADLKDGDGSLTRSVCARVAQLEILREELPRLVAETAADEKLGCYTSPLVLKGGLESSIRFLRGKFAEGDKGRLPCLLGRDSSDEAVGDLALNTISHAMIVALATMRSVNVALGKSVAAARIPFLPIAGTTSRRWYNRAGVVVALLGAVSYVAARLVTTTPPTQASLASFHSPHVLLTWVAWLGIIGVVAVPLLRMWRAPGWRHVTQGFAALVLLAGALGVPIGIAAAYGNLATVDVLTTGTAFRLPEALAWVALAAVVAGQPLRRISVPGKSAVEHALKRVSLTVVVGTVAAVVAGISILHLAPSLGSPDTWRFAVAVSALASVPLLILYLVLGTRR